MVLRLDKSHLKIAKLQVSGLKEDPDIYNKLSKAEYDSFKDYIKKPQKILELGCGLGRMSVYLNKQLDYEPEFILADFDEISEDIRYGWNPRDTRYNRLENTRKFCIDNDLKRFETFNLAERDISELRDIDLVISVLAVGFHYPMEQYMDKLLDITTEDVVMVFGMRSLGKLRRLYFKMFRDKFKMIKFMESIDIEPKERMMILEGKV